jgi:LysM repeat protein
MLFVALARAGSAQENIVQGATPDLYLFHKVTPKETLYGIGRTYNISAKELAAYNNFSISTPLEIGQQVKIPLTSANFFQSEIKEPNEALIPLYHIIQPREWLYRISVNHNKVPVETIEKWNHITKDEAKAGTKLIVGFLKTNDNDAVAVTKPSQESNASTTSVSPPKKNV